MEPINFVYWLQGFFEISDTVELNEKQVEVIKKHLALVLTNVTGGKNAIDFSKKIQEIMTKENKNRNNDGLICSPGNDKKYC